MGQYLILLYEDEAAWAAVGEQESEEILGAHGAFASRHGAALRGGGWLQPTTTATTLVGDGPGFGAGHEATVTDGPFVETKEALGGFYVVEAADLDEALAMAREVPTPFGGVEVRPLRAM